MFRKLLIGTALTGVLAFGIPTATFAQTSDAKHDIKKAGREMKKAGKESGEAAKDTAKAVKHSVKASRRMSTRRVRTTCVDGKIHHGRTRTSACANRGGLRS